MNPHQLVKAAHDQDNFAQLLTWSLAFARDSLANQPRKLKVLSTTHAYKTTLHSHFHHCPEMFIQLVGRARVDHADGTTMLNKGDVLLIPRGVGHLEAPAQVDKTCINIVFTYNDWGFRGHSARSQKPRILSRLAVPQNDISRCTGWLNEACSYAQNIGDGDPLPHSLVMAHLNRLIQVLTTEKEEHNQHPPKVAHALELINRHITDNHLSVEWIADQMRCSADYMGTLFNQHIGQTITRYIANERCTRGAQLLLASDLSISDISRACGYRDPGYFRRQFAYHQGTSPRQYRKRHAESVFRTGKRSS